MRSTPVCFSKSKARVLLKSRLVWGLLALFVLPALEISALQNSPGPKTQGYEVFCIAFRSANGGFPEWRVDPFHGLLHRYSGNRRRHANRRLHHRRKRAQTRHLVLFEQRKGGGEILGRLYRRDLPVPFGPLRQSRKPHSGRSGQTRDSGLPRLRSARSSRCLLVLFDDPQRDTSSYPRRWVSRGASQRKLFRRPRANPGLDRRPRNGLPTKVYVELRDRRDSVGFDAGRHSECDRRSNSCHDSQIR